MLSYFQFFQSLLIFGAFLQFIFQYFETNVLKCRDVFSGSSPYLGRLVCSV